LVASSGLCEKEDEPLRTGFGMMVRPISGDEWQQNTQVQLRQHKWQVTLQHQNAFRY